MGIINRPDLVEKLRRQFGILQSQIGSTLSDELLGVVIVDDVSGPDVDSEGHPLRCLGSSSSAAAVGFFSKVGLQNPVGSGLDIFVERVVLTRAATLFETIRVSAIAASPNAGIRRFLDSRVVGTPVGVTWDENATVSLGVEIMEVVALANLTLPIELGLTLAPGDSVHVQSGAANVAVSSAHFFWTERIRRE